MPWPFSAGEILTASNLNDAIPRSNAAICQVSTSTGNTLSNGATATLSWETESLDPSGWFAPGAPTLITPLIEGWYQVAVRVGVAADPDNDFTRFYVSVQKNSADLFITNMEAAPVGVAQITMTTPLVQMNGSTDNLRVQALQSNTDADAYTPSGFFCVELKHWT